MRDTYFIVFSEDGVNRLRKRPPNVGPGEFFVKQTLKVDDSLFGELQFVGEETIEPDAHDIGHHDVHTHLDGLEGVCTGPAIHTGHEQWEKRYRCPECGFENGSEFGVHYAPGGGGA